MPRNIVIITGASGTLGSSLIKSFQNEKDQEFDIIAITHSKNIDGCYQNIKVDLEKPLPQTFCNEMRDILKDRKVAGLIWAAGAYYKEDFESHSLLENFQKQWYLNCYNLLEMSKNLLPHIDREKGGHIIAVSSMLSARSSNGSFSYGTTKGMQNVIVQKLSFELAKYNVRVNGINPGLFRSNMSEQTWNNPEKLERLRNNIPLGRFVENTELVNLINFIFKENCPSLTGQNLFIEGGNLLCF